ncbi:cation/H(+) antiporter 15-like [Asparagus officinalis]|uniref:cation/H(+) antiporter 15-like n=1 Tax=Asparagus officinalis TaxID=4686 RepID=UPI00098DFFD9|nr:cation/H(+) antiporter 15-like [Asparagus officinalis]
MLLGPTFIGRSMGFEKLLFSMNSWEHVNTLSLLSFMLFIFMIGVKTDLDMIRKTGKKAIAVAIVGTFLSFFLVLSLAYAFRSHIPPSFRNRVLISTFAYRWSMTSYTVLTCTLTELNLLTSKLGRLAMSASLIADFVNLTVSAGFQSYLIGSKQKDLLLSGMSFLAFLGFIGFIVFVARPVTVWIVNRTPEGSLLDEPSLIAVIFLALLCGVLSEAIGFHTNMGAFLFGLVIPGGEPLGVTLVERLERLVEGVFLPMYVVQSGLRVDLAGLKYIMEWGFIEFLVLVSILGKFFGVLFVCLYCKMSTRDAFSLALIMTNKGILEVENAGFWLDAQMITHQAFTVLILSVIIFGGVTSPFIKYIYRPEDRFIAYKRRTVQHTKPSAELRILACIYHQENVNSILSLLESTHPSSSSPICIYVLHLTNLVGRAAAILAPYKRNKSSNLITETDHIVNAFNYFSQQNPNNSVTILPFVCLSPYSTMHDDVCSLALDKKAALVLLPFHKHLAIDGTIESINPNIQNVNVNVLHYAPCSVGVLATLSTATMSRVAVYFFGGPDDREALAYGMRIAENDTVGLTLVRFRPPKELRDSGMEMKLDDAIVDEFRRRMVDDNRVVYREEVVIDGEGTVGVIRAMSSQFSLLIVGRREGKESRLTEGLSAWNEYPELGVVGDLLASTDFGGRVSTLVVQQQTRFGAGGKGQTAGRQKVHHQRQVAPAEFDEE